MIGHGKLEAEQAEDGADQPFRLAQRQAKHGPQRQRGQDRQCRVVRLAAWGGTGLSAPGRDRRLREPDGEAAALP